MSYLFRLKLGKGEYGQGANQITGNDLLLINNDYDLSINTLFNGLQGLTFDIGSLQNVKVPYTGAINDVNLGNHTLELGKEQIISDVGRFRNLLMSADSNSSLLRTQHRTRNNPTSTSYSITDNIGLGVSALKENIGRDVVAIGRSAAEFNKGGRSNGVGTYALASNLGTNCNGFGVNALRNNQGNFCEGIGYEALYFNTGNNVISIGIFSGRGNTGNDVILFGNDAGRNNTGNNSIGIGADSLKENKQDDNIAIGHNSFSTTNTTITNTITIGVNSQPTKSNQVVLGNSLTEEVVTEKDFVSRGGGSGLILTTPDGLNKYRISIDNSGNIISTLV